MDKKRILWIDFMRSICVIYIVGFWHLDDYMSIEIQEITANNFTYQTVYCILATFTLLCGFFVDNNPIMSLNDVISFYKKKILRLYPLYALACILFVWCGYSSLNSLPIYLLGLGEFIRPFPATLWFMCMVFIFYFLAPFLIKISKPYRQFLFFLVVEIVFFVCHYIFSTDIRLAYYWPFFYLGLISKHNCWYFKLDRNILFTIVSALIYIGLSFTLGEQFVPLTYICALSFVCLLSSILMHFFKNVERNRLFEFISYSSMCAYLFHRVIYIAIAKWGGTFGVVEAYLVYLPLVFGVSGLIQYGYNKILFFVFRNVK